MTEPARRSQRQARNSQSASEGASQAAPDAKWASEGASKTAPDAIVPEARLRHDGTSEGASNKLWTIGELADELGLTTRAIRFYEAKGLLAPERRGVARSYTRRDRARILLILRGKNLGFTLDDIREYLELYDADPAHLAQLKLLKGKVEAHIAELDKKRADIERTLRELHEIRAQCEKHLGAKPSEG